METVQKLIEQLWSFIQNFTGRSVMFFVHSSILLLCSVALCFFVKRDKKKKDNNKEQIKKVVAVTKKPDYKDLGIDERDHKIHEAHWPNWRLKLYYSQKGH